MSEKRDHTIIYRYTFLLDNGIEKVFDLHLDRKRLGMVPGERTSYPHWARLTCCKCSNCPLNEEEHPHCPIAVNIIDLMDFFNDVVSFKEVDVQIEADERSYVKRTTMSQAISSLLGIYMVTSGCPVMDKLRPMVRFHLPLASAEETTFRALSMYLVAQYFLNKRGVDPDWELKKLPDIYTEVQTVNQSFAQRLRETAINDASLNALSRLDTYAGVILVSIDFDRMEDIEALFESYFV